MPSFRIKGFPEASVVALTLSQGAASVNGNVNSWGSTASGVTGDLTITSAFTEQSGGQTIAPGAVWLSVTGWTGWDTPVVPLANRTYYPQVHNIEYFWTITGPGNFSARSDINLPTTPSVYRDCSVQRGPKVCFPLTAPGRYTWTLFAVEQSSGKTCTKEGTIDTVSEDSAFPGTRTICYSPAGIFTGAPEGAQQISTLSAMQSALSTLNAGTTTYRILLRRGETYAGSNINFTWPTTFPNFRSGTYGAGADPIVTAPFGSSLFSFPAGGGAKHVWVGPIDWRGRWDAVNERGFHDDRNLDSANQAQLTYVRYRAKVSGCNTPHSMPDGTSSGNAFAADINCYYTHFRHFGHQSASNAGVRPTLAYIGTQMDWPAGSVDGGYRLPEVANDYAARLHNGGTGGGWIMRHGGDQDVTIQHCSFTSGNGGDQQGATSPQHQALRWNTNARTGVLYSMAFSLFEGGLNSMSMVGNSRDVNYLVDACVFVASGATENYYVGGGIHGSTTRNCQFLHFVNVRNPWVATFTTNGAVDFAPVLYYGNSFYMKRNAFFPTIVEQTGGFNANSGGADLVFPRFYENFIVGKVAPTGIDLSEAIAGFTPRYIGQKIGFPSIRITLASPVANGGTIATLPYASTTALNRQNGTVTDQAYWLASAGTDHVVSRNGATGSTDIFYAAFSQISVTFGASAITITNTSGGPVPAGDYNIKLDRAGQMTVDTSLASDALGAVSWVKIAAGSEASFVTTSGLRSYRDLNNTVRGTPAYRGAIEV